MLENESYMN